MSAHDPKTAQATTPSALPTPRLKVVPAKPGYPKDGGRLDLLVSLGVDLPSLDVDRKPLALALVVDRSGSMSGQPLEAAKAATCAAIEMLLPDDWVSVVAFDSTVDIIVPLTPSGRDRSALLASVKAIQTRGSTALYAGWAEGLSQVMACPQQDAAARVVVLSDGGANVGISDAPSIAADVAQATAHGVTTTGMGFGRHYDENLMRALADAGNGNYVFVEDASQVGEAFQQELSGLSALRGRNVRLEPSTGMTLASAVAGQLPPAGCGVRLPDLVGGLDRDIVLTATFDAGAPAPELTLAWSDTLTGAEDRMTLKLDLPAVSTTEFEALPTDPVVTVQASLAQIAGLKLRLSDALRSGQAADSARLLGELQAAIERLPEGEERSAEQRELARLREFEKARDAAMAARFTERKARDRAFGVSDQKRSRQYVNERELHALKLQAIEGAGGAWASGVAKAQATGWLTGSPGPATPAGRRPLAQVRIDGRHGPVSVRVLLADITEQAVDVLVNSTNRRLFGNAGVDGAVHRRAGPELTQAVRQIGGLDYGQAVFTPGFRLPARYVVHTAAMPWQGGNSGEVEILERAYRSAFAVSAQLGARSLAVTALGTGSYGVPLDVAVRTAFAALQEAIVQGAPFSEVSFVILDPAIANVFAAELPGILTGRTAAPTN